MKPPSIDHCMVRSWATVPPVATTNWHLLNICLLSSVEIKFGGSSYFCCTLDLHPNIHRSCKRKVAGREPFSVFTVASIGVNPCLVHCKTEPPRGAATRVAAAGPGCLLRDRRSTQSLYEELRRAWPPLARSCQAQCTEVFTRSCGARERRLPGCLYLADAVHRASTRLRREAAAGPAAFCAAGAVHRASTRSCGAWPPLARGCLSRGRRIHRDSTSSCGARGRSWSAAAFFVAGAVHRTSTELRGAWPPLGAAAFSVAGAVYRASLRSCGARLTAAAF